MQKLTSKGFGGATLILFIVILGAIAGVGYFVYTSQKQAQKPLDTASQTQNEAQNAAEKYEITALSDTETANWLEYKASGYSIRFADGWKIMKKSGSSDSFIANENDSLKHTPGKTAVVEEYVQSGPGESIYGMYIDFENQPESNCAEYSKSTVSFKTKQGADVYRTVTKGPGPNLIEGDVSYYYCIQLSPTDLLSIGYTTGKTLEDHSKIVEQVILTVKPL